MKGSGSMRNFYVLSFSQLVSGLGSNITIFAIGLWVFKKKGGSITDMALIHFINEIPRLMISPFAGIITDRGNRKAIMVVCDFVAAIMTAFVGYYLYLNKLEIWHIYLCNFVTSLSTHLQLPACEAVIPQIVPKDKLSLAMGFSEVVRGLMELLCPAIAGVLYVSFGIEWIIVLDLTTWAIAELILILLVTIPPYEQSEEGKAANALPFWQELQFGFNYIYAKKPLRDLTLLFTLSNFVTQVINVLMPTLLMIVCDETTHGIVVSCAGCGILVGGIAITIWGTPLKQFTWILRSILLHGLLLVGSFFMPPLPIVIGVMGFMYLLVEPLISASCSTIWSCSVPNDIQGRVFSAKYVLTTFTFPISTLVSGPLADQIEPFLSEGGYCDRTTIGLITGIGKGKGIQLILLFLGIFLLLSVYWAYATCEFGFLDAVMDETQSEEKKEKKKKKESKKTK